MANRAQRRANQKAARTTTKNGQPEVSRSATTQATFNNQADRVAEGKDQWVPGRIDPDGNVIDETAEEAETAAPKISRKRTWRDWLKVCSWTLITLSAIAFLVVMWIPNLPIWAVITVSAFFVVGVLSLFVVRGDHDKNPYLDENGTAV